MCVCWDTLIAHLVEWTAPALTTCLPSPFQLFPVTQLSYRINAKEAPQKSVCYCPGGYFTDVALNDGKGEDTRNNWKEHSRFKLIG